MNSDEIVVRAPGDVVETAPSPEVSGVFSLIQVGLQNNQTPEALQGLYEIYQQERDDARRRSAIAAKVALVRSLPVILKDGTVAQNGKVRFKWTTYGALRKVIDPLLTEHGFVLTHQLDGENRVQAVLSHMSGFEETSGWMSLPDAKAPGMSAVQGEGSRVAYAKRYTTELVLGLSSHDTDDSGQAPVIDDVAENHAGLQERASAKAAEGMKAYEAFFLNLTRSERTFLTQTDGSVPSYHEINKSIAQEKDDE